MCSLRWVFCALLVLCTEALAAPSLPSMRVHQQPGKGKTELRRRDGDATQNFAEQPGVRATAVDNTGQFLFVAYNKTLVTYSTQNGSVLAAISTFDICQNYGVYMLTVVDKQLVAVCNGFAFFQITDSGALLNQTVIASPSTYCSASVRSKDNHYVLYSCDQSLVLIDVQAYTMTKKALPGAVPRCMQITADGSTITGTLNQHQIWSAKLALPAFPDVVAVDLPENVYYGPPGECVFYPNTDVLLVPGDVGDLLAVRKTAFLGPAEATPDTVGTFYRSLSFSEDGHYAAFVPYDKTQVHFFRVYPTDASAPMFTLNMTLLARVPLDPPSPALYVSSPAATVSTAASAFIVTDDQRIGVYPLTGNISTPRAVVPFATSEVVRDIGISFDGQRQYTLTNMALYVYNNSTVLSRWPLQNASMFSVVESQLYVYSRTLAGDAALLVLQVASGTGALSFASSFGLAQYNCHAIKANQGDLYLSCVKALVVFHVATGTYSAVVSEIDDTGSCLAINNELKLLFRPLAYRSKFEIYSLATSPPTLNATNDLGFPKMPLTSHERTCAFFPGTGVALAYPLVPSWDAMGYEYEGVDAVAGRSIGRLTLDSSVGEFNGPVVFFGGGKYAFFQTSDGTFVYTVPNLPCPSAQANFLEQRVHRTGIHFPDDSVFDDHRYVVVAPCFPLNCSTVIALEATSFGVQLLSVSDLPDPGTVPCPSPSPPPPPPSGGGDKTGLIIGLVCAGVVVAMAGAWWYKRRKQREEDSMRAPLNAGMMDDY